MRDRRIGRHHDMEEVFADGIVGLHEAIRRFDLSRGSRFSTAAVWSIRQAMQRGARMTAAVTGPTSEQGRLLESRSLEDYEIPSVEPSVEETEAGRIVALMRRVADTLAQPHSTIIHRHLLDRETNAAVIGEMVESGLLARKVSVSWFSRMCRDARYEFANEMRLHDELIEFSDVLLGRLDKAAADVIRKRHLRLGDSKRFLTLRDDLPVAREHFYDSLRRLSLAGDSLATMILEHQ